MNIAVETCPFHIEARKDAFREREEIRAVYDKAIDALIQAKQDHRAFNPDCSREVSLHSLDRLTEIIPPLVELIDAIAEQPKPYNTDCGLADDIGHGTEELLDMLEYQKRELDG